MTGATATVSPDDTARAQRLARLWETAPGLYGVLATVDHKRIGKRYLVTAFVFLVLGGVAALAMRAQLARPDLHWLTPAQYNQLFTMHGVTMIFLYAAPVLSGFSNYLWPLILGARDMAYPRVNALGYWTFLMSGLFLYSSILIGQSPDGGWFAYVPMTGRAYSPGLNLDFYALGLLFLGISTTIGAVNFITTFFKLRAPGMSLDRVPVLLWGTLSVSFAVLFAMPALTVACVMLFLARRFGMHFFDPAYGGHPLLWQHLFWMFGHPWVYIIVLPAMGFASEMILVFSRRPLAGYALVVLATITTVMLGFGVWVHHMFAAGVPQLSTTFVSATSMVIAIPSGVAVVAWITTIWLGRPVFKVPFLFMCGFIVLFIIGGLSGVMTAAVPFDWQLTDTYFVVAHIHYVLVGINVFPVMGALYFWVPKMTGRLLSERLGRWVFWLMFVGANVAFFPMHISGMLGMPRRVFTYQGGLGWGTLNLISTAGAYLFAVGVVLFLVDLVRSRWHGAPAGDNPWDAPTLEWSTMSPPPVYNFATLPDVHSRHPLWEARLAEHGAYVPFREAPPGGHRETVSTSSLDADPIEMLRMPDDSLLPVLLSLAMLGLCYGLLMERWWLTGAGAAGLLATAVVWFWPRGVPERHVDDRPPEWWGMALVVATEAAFFVYLLFSYFYLGAMAPGAWPPHGAPDLTLTLPNTLILLSSSVAVWWGASGIQAGKQGRLRAGLLVTCVLGVVFLALQGVEYAQAPFTPSAGAYASLFFSITGFHGAHVAVGVIMLLVVQVRAWMGHFTAERHIAVRNVTMYWHFVDAVWLAVFLSLYVLPRVG